MNNIKTLINTDLFKGFSNKNIKEILKDKETYIKTYNKNSTIATENAPCDSIGILIDGEIEIIKENASGNLSILRSFIKVIYSVKWPFSQPIGNGRPLFK